MQIKRLKGKYEDLVREFETTKDILEYNYKVDRQIYDNIINNKLIYYYLARNYNNFNRILYIIRYDKDNEEFYSEYITEYSHNDKDIMLKAYIRVKNEDKKMRKVNEIWKVKEGSKNVWKVQCPKGILSFRTKNEAQAWVKATISKEVSNK